MGRLILVSNRLPVNIVREKDKILLKQSVGGVATGLSSVRKRKECVWLGWPGAVYRKDTHEGKIIRKELKKNSCYPVSLSSKDIENFYYGFSNKTIWPLFHYFTQYTVFDKKFWNSYRKVNEIFKNEVLKVYKKGDTVWIHDYHLMLLPKLLRDESPSMNIGIFIHIPFPSWEIFRLLPWRREILEGILGADLIGFHIYDYVLHFLESVNRVFGYTHEFGKLILNERIVKVDAFPMGIDYKKYHDAPLLPEVQKEVKRIKDRVGTRKIILSIDRLDYTKGIPERLIAYDLFLEENPEFRGKVVLILVAVPSRTKVEHYRILKRRVDELVGRINAKYGSISWIPVWYIYNTLPFQTLIALYHVSDIALITPIRDGMNLISKEYVASKRDGNGVLILSEMAGASKVLTEALIINPNDIPNIVDSIKHALIMSEDRKKERIFKMQENISRYNIYWWVESFISGIEEISEIREKLQNKYLGKKRRKEIIKRYKHSKNVLFLLDYDGTLIEFFKNPMDAKPTRRIISILKKLIKRDGNEVVILSGREKSIIDKWFGKIQSLNFSAEHGAWIKMKDGKWRTIEEMKSNWKKEILPILENFVSRTPGSFIEEKDFSLCWHYRNVPQEFGVERAGELIASLSNLIANLELQILKGNKVVEIRNIAINKGRAALKWIERKKWDMIISIGDDTTDEDIFKNLPDDAVSIKVGEGPTYAKYTLKNPHEVRDFLLEFLK